MSNFLENILAKLSLKVENISLDVQNISVNLSDKTTSIESGDFTISNIYKGDSLITPQINFNITNLSVPLDDIYPLLEEKLFKKGKLSE